LVLSGGVIGRTLCDPVVAVAIGLKCHEIRVAVQPFIEHARGLEHLSDQAARIEAQAPRGSYLHAVDDEPGEADELRPFIACAAGSRTRQRGAAAALRQARAAGRPSLVTYVTGGIREDWTDLLAAMIEAGADAVEIGLPFSDPMLDGRTIQQATTSRRPDRLAWTPP
jgi:hypothetical protein